MGPMALVLGQWALWHWSKDNGPYGTGLRVGCRMYWSKGRVPHVLVYGRVYWSMAA